ncbi:HNH endonuclease, partial [Patescibacteria group bacterium]|nr:HNH endonuclease [Patescibacteria group bacterium]
GKPDDDEFINLKTDEEKVKEYRWASNNSISCPSSYKNFEKFVEPIMLNGEPGFVMLHNCQKYGRMNGILDTRDKKAKGVNPCLSGDTLVYVADGRGTVSIKQLSEENKDIPVFCLDDKNNLVVRYMRNPRLTGKNEQIIKITLENGHMLKSTPDHKFLTSNNGYMNAKDLMIGQGLSILTRYKSKINNSKKDYWWTKFNEYKNLEHRIIGKFIYPKLENDLTIHHKNFDSLDNTNDNLEIMTRKEHLILHNKLAQVQGEKNPNFCGVTNDKLKEHALKLTKIKQRKFSWSEWKLYAKKNDLPYDFSDWRKKHLNSIAGLAKWAAKKLGYEHYNLDPRKIKTLEELLEQGYDCEVKNNKILIKKLCEICEKPFLIDSNYREQSLCSNACTLRNLKILGSKKIYPKSLGSNQIDIYNDLCKNLNRIPKLREWKKSCKENNVDYTLYHKNSPFNSYTELQKSAKLTNHKIIKLETVDSEDVYNGTVDEFHNFFVGGYDEGGDTIFTNNLQCGEQVLESGECCNLVELFPSRCESLDEFKRAIKYAYLYAKTVTLTKTPWPRTNEIMLRNRRIGLGMAGIIENINRLGFAEHISWCEEGYTYVQELDKTYSDWLCIPRSIRTTTSKPGGTTPFLPGVTPGIHYPHSKYYIRNIRITRGNPLLDALKKAGYQIEQDKYEKSSMVVSFPVKENHFTRGKYDVTMWEQLENAAQMQEHWSDNSVSITVTVKPEEKDQLVEALDRYQSRLKTVSFLPLKDHNYEQAPYIKITEKEYKRLVKKLKKLDLSKTEHEITEKFCDGDTCTI